MPNRVNSHRVDIVHFTDLITNFEKNEFSWAYHNFMPFQRMSNTWEDYSKKPLEFSTSRRRFFPLSYNLTNLNRPVLLDNDDMIVSLIKYDYCLK